MTKYEEIVSKIEHHIEARSQLIDTLSIKRISNNKLIAEYSVGGKELVFLKNIDQDEDFFRSVAKYFNEMLSEVPND